MVQTGFGSIRTEALVGTAYESDVDAARSTAIAALRRADGVLADPSPLVLVTKLGTSTVDLQLLFWTEPQQRVRDRVLSEVKVALDQAGVEMPAQVVALKGTPSLKAALRDDAQQPTQAGGARPAREGGAHQVPDQV